MVADMVYLYEQIRDTSRRLEFEWRDEFLRYFPAARDALPPTGVAEEQYGRDNPHPQSAFTEVDIPM